MATGVAVLRELARRLEPDALWPVTGTATGGSTTTLVDTTELTYSSADANALDGKFVFNETQGETGRVTRGGYATDGTVTFSPTVSTGFSSGEKFIISSHPIWKLQEAINSIQRNLYMMTYWPLTSLIVGNDNNDMEGSGLDGDYSKSASAALTQETTIVHRGANSMKVVATAATQYAYTASFGVNENRQYYASVFCYVTQGDAGEFRIVNVQDSNATIENATSDEPSWMELAFPLTTPSGCEQVQAWMISSANGDITYYDDFILLDTAQIDFRLPSWMKWQTQMRDVVYFPKGASGPASDNDYRVDETRAQSWPWGFSLADVRALDEVRIWIAPAARRLYVKALRPLTEISTWTAVGAGDSTAADTDVVVEHCLNLLREPERADRYLARLRHLQLSQAVSVPSNRMSVRG